MFNFKKNLLIHFLRDIKKSRKEENKPFTIIIDGGKSVDLTIFARMALKHYNLEYDNKFGFVIHLFFNKNKDNNELYLSRFNKNKYFDLFTMVQKDGNDNYILDCRDDIHKTEVIALDILKNVYDFKKVKSKNIMIY